MSLRDGDLNVFVMDTDGANVVRLTSDPAEDYYPTWAVGG